MRLVDASWIAWGRRSTAASARSSHPSGCGATYYSILSLFRACSSCLAALPAWQYPETTRACQHAFAMRPGTAVDTINSGLRDALVEPEQCRLAAGRGDRALAVLRLRTMGASMRSLEAINRAPKGRDFLPNLGVRLGLTCLVTLLVLVAFLSVSSPALFGRSPTRRFPRIRQGACRLSALADRRGCAARRLRDRLRPRPRHTPKRGDRSLRSVLPGRPSAFSSGSPFPFSSRSMCPISALMTRPMALSAR